MSQYQCEFHAKLSNRELRVLTLKDIACGIRASVERHLERIVQDGRKIGESFKSLANSRGVRNMSGHNRKCSNGLRALVLPAVFVVQQRRDGPAQANEFMNRKRGWQ